MKHPDLMSLDRSAEKTRLKMIFPEGPIPEPTVVYREILDDPEKLILYEKSLPYERIYYAHHHFYQHYPGRQRGPAPMSLKYLALHRIRENQRDGVAHPNGILPHVPE